MTGEHRKSIGIRTAFILVTALATMDTKPAGAQMSAISGGDQSRQSETLTAPSESNAHQPGYYLRVGASLDLSSTTRFGDRNCLSTSPAALYGCGTGGDGIARGTRGDFGMAGGVEVGLGYVAVPGLRLETSIAYHPRFAFEGTANFLQTDEIQSVSVGLRGDSP